MTLHTATPQHPALRAFIQAFLLEEISPEEHSTQIINTLAGPLTGLIFPLHDLGHTTNTATSDTATSDITLFHKPYIHGKLTRLRTDIQQCAEDGSVRLFFIDFTPIGLYRFMRKPLGTLNGTDNSFFSAEHLLLDVSFLQEQLQEVYYAVSKRQELDFASPDMARSKSHAKIEALALCAEAYMSGLLSASAGRGIPLHEMRKVQQAEYVCNRLRATHGKAHIGTIASELQISERQISRIMTEIIGISGKSFGQDQRFVYCWQLLSQIAAAAPKGSVIPAGQIHSALYQAGYYDLSHAIREFKQITGSTPHQFMLGRDKNITLEAFARYTEGTDVKKPHDAS
jgi:AraC-like DNA-binding protein